MRSLPRRLPPRFPSSAVLPLAALAIIGLLALLPDLAPRIAADQAVEASHGKIEAIVPRGADEPLRPPFARVLILDGPRAGQVVEAYLEGPGGSQIVANYQVGDEVVVTVTLDQAGDPYVAVSDRWRAPLLGAFVLVFAAAVVLVGGVRGARALLSLGLTIAVILKILIPLVVAGVAPVPLAVLTATAVTVVTILLTEGWTRASWAAIVGTAGALALTGLLAAAATAFASFTYSAGSDLAFLQTTDGRGLDLRGMLLAAFILGAVGVLDDVTVTQAALVESLAARGATGRELIGEAFDVGRSHIAATVNTLFLAYVGAGLPLLVTIVVSNQPSALVFNSETVATEVVRTLVGSLGILAAVPFTTVVAAAIVDRSAGADLPWSRDRRRVGLGAAVVIIAMALAATAIVPLGSGRPSLPNEAIGPSSVPGGSPAVPTDDPSGSVEPGSSDPAEPAILALGERYHLVTDATAIDVTVLTVDADSVDSQLAVTIGVSYENVGGSDVSIDPAAWRLISANGEDVGMEPAPSDGLATASLRAGETATGRLVGTIAAAADETFVTFTDAGGLILFAVPANGT